ncbi:MAG: SHD1 domain-containing protein [Mariniblastus sp.]
MIQAKNLRGSQLDTAIEQLVARAEGDGAEGGLFISEWRTFEDSQGKFQVEARLVGMEGGEVILLRRSDQVEINVPLSRLSKRDQSFSRTEIKRLNAMNRL